jgi:hypothetical protein
LLRDEGPQHFAHVGELPELIFDCATTNARLGWFDLMLQRRSAHERAKGQQAGRQKGKRANLCP